ncbi:MAG TPA: hypothetical protein VMB49_01210 [Acidobacteriaceae bacterium]|nr:hypothetical protein [Acidobacteriaceae bacterium]
MADETTIKRPSNLEEFHTSETGEDKKIDRIAEKAAERAGERQKKYDESHDIFTK